MIGKLTYCPHTGGKPKANFKCNICFPRKGWEEKMFSFRAMTRATHKALESGVDRSFKDWKPAHWLANYFDGHRYGIKFDDDDVVRADNGDFIYDTAKPLPPKEKQNDQQT